MPKYRQLHTKVIDSFDFNEMPDDFTRVVWLLLPLILDREGRGIANTAWVKSKMFPLRDEISNEMIGASMAWMIERKMIISYEVNGHVYFYVPNFKKYQVHTEREAASLLPAPPAIDELQSKSGVTPELVRQSSLTYESESESESVLILNAKKTFSIVDAEKALLQVTEFVSLPSTYHSFLESILDLLQNYGWKETIERLTKAKDNWINQKNKTNGARYKLTNPGWIDFAITGEQIGTIKLSEKERSKQEMDRIKEATKYQR
jgi:hypothetical protein